MYIHNVYPSNRKLGKKRKSSQKIHSSRHTRGLSRLDCLGLTAAPLAACTRLQCISQSLSIESTESDTMHHRLSVLSSYQPTGSMAIEREMSTLPTLLVGYGTFTFSLAMHN